MYLSFNQHGDFDDKFTKIIECTELQSFETNAVCTKTKYTFRCRSPWLLGFSNPSDYFDKLTDTQNRAQNTQIKTLGEF
jgi:hypothetical protein